MNHKTEILNTEEYSNIQIRHMHAPGLSNRFLNNSHL